MTFAQKVNPTEALVSALLPQKERQDEYRLYLEPKMLHLQINAINRGVVSRHY